MCFVHELKSSMDRITKEQATTVLYIFLFLAQEQKRKREQQIA